MAKSKKNKVVIRDPNAKAMWGRVKSATFTDKTKYNRKRLKKISEE